MENIKEYTSRKKEELKNYIKEHNYDINIVVVQVGNNQASNSYIKGKLKDCDEVGIHCELKKFDENITEEKLLYEIYSLNKYSSSVDGYIVQLPLPQHINEDKIVNAINYHKDIDGFTKDAFVNPATPQGIITYLEDNDFKFEDANAVVIGRSNIVGRPIARLLLDKGCNVTVIHSKTSQHNKELALEDADLIVCATGHRNTIVDDDFNRELYQNGIYDPYWKEHTHNNCFIVDVGINRNEDGKLCGDCESVTVCEKTPVPGGVGLLTRLALLNNIVKLYEINHH